MKRSFCISHRQAQRHSLVEVLTQVSAAGFGGIELWPPSNNPNGHAPLEEICEAAASAGLVVCLFPGHDSIERGLNDPTQWERIEEELRLSIAKAAKLAIPGVICFSGVRGPGVSDAHCGP